MKSMGNARAKEIWEARVPSDYPMPRETDPQSVIKKWIVAKYENQEFKAKEPPLSKSSSMDKPKPAPSPTMGNYSNFNTPVASSSFPTMGKRIAPCVKCYSLPLENDLSFSKGKE